MLSEGMKPRGSQLNDYHWDYGFIFFFNGFLNLWLWLALSYTHDEYIYIHLSVLTSRPALSSSLSDASSSVAILLLSLFYVQCLSCYWVWLYCLLLELRLDSAEGCCCFTQTHPETRHYWDTLLSSPFLFQLSVSTCLLCSLILFQTSLALFHFLSACRPLCSLSLSVLWYLFGNLIWNSPLSTCQMFSSYSDERRRACLVRSHVVRTCWTCCCQTR